MSYPWPVQLAFWLIVAGLGLILLAGAGFAWFEVVRRIVSCS